MKQLVAILLSVTFVTCSQSSTDRSSKAIGTTSVKPLYANSVTRHFSSKYQKDSMSVSVNGESIITGEVFLQITNHEGKRIFTATFPANALLSHDGLINPKRDEKIIKDGIDSFFRETRSVTPVAPKPDLAIMADSTKAAWKTIQTDPVAVCFSYQDSKGGISQIAYSKSLQKVVQWRSLRS